MTPILVGLRTSLMSTAGMSGQKGSALAGGQLFGRTCRPSYAIPLRKPQSCRDAISPSLVQRRQHREWRPGFKGAATARSDRPDLQRMQPRSRLVALANIARIDEVARRKWSPRPMGRLSASLRVSSLAGSIGRNYRYLAESGRRAGTDDGEKLSRASEARGCFPAG